MISPRWFWPGTLLLPGVGLLVQEALSFSNLYLGESLREQVLTAAGWGLWVAAPYLVVGVQLGVATRRSRPAWWLSLAAGVAVTLVGLWLAVAGIYDDSTDPLAGLTWVLTPLVQLGVAIGTGLAVVILSVLERSRGAVSVGRLNV